MPSYIDFRYPGIFSLNRSAEMPSSFGPPNMASMFQSGISALADPLVTRMKEDQARAETAKNAADYLTAYKDLYSKSSTTSDTTATSTAATPRPRDTSTIGSPAGDDPGGVQAGGVGASGLAQSDVRDTFMNTVKAGGLTNPYGLAAVAATGQAETSWSPGRLTTAWNDLGRPSGGALSWRAERLQAMRNFTRGSDNPAEAQARFFLNEDPQLIARLNQARSPEEANALMARAWRYKGYDGGPQFAKREALTKQYAAQLGDPAPAPAPAPQASFAPTVAPAPTPQAAAAVAAPQGPQQAPQPQPVQTPDRAAVLANHDRAVAAARASGDRARADQLSAMRPVIAAGGGPGAPAAQPAPQQPQPQQQQQDPQAAMQQQVVSGVEEGDQVINDRLNATRQAGQTRVASLSPQLPGLGLGGAVPTGGPAAAGLAPPRAVPTTREPPPPDAAPPSPIPMVPPQAALPRPAPAASAPTAPAGPLVPPSAPAGVPTPGPAPGPPQPAPPPVRVAQAAGLPPAVNAQHRGSIDPRMAEVMLRNARTPEEVNKIGQALLLSLQPPAPSAERFQIIKDNNNNWVRLDRLSGAVVPMPVGPGTGYREMTPAEKQKFGIPENTGAFIGPDGKPHVLPGTASTKIQVTPEAKGDEKYNEEQAKGIRKRFNDIVEEGDKAGRAKVDLNTLGEIFARTGPQGVSANIKTVVGPYLEAAGIDVAGLSDAQTVQSVIERMAPQQRVTGSGSTSDVEYKGFLRSLPTLMQSPEARTQVLSMLQTQNDIAIKRAEVIASHDEGTIDRKTAQQQLRALPKHEDVFQQFKEQNRELYTQAQRDAMQRRDSGNVKELREAQERAAAPATPKTQADYDALPSGRHYVDPETNKIKRKK